MADLLDPSAGLALDQWAQARAPRFFTTTWCPTLVTIGLYDGKTSVTASSWSNDPRARRWPQLVTDTLAEFERAALEAASSAELPAHHHDRDHREDAAQ